MCHNRGGRPSCGSNSECLEFGTIACRFQAVDRAIPDCSGVRRGDLGIPGLCYEQSRAARHGQSHERSPIPSVAGQRRFQHPGPFCVDSGTLLRRDRGSSGELVVAKVAAGSRHSYTDSFNTATTRAGRSRSTAARTGSGAFCTTSCRPCEYHHRAPDLCDNAIAI